MHLLEKLLLFTTGFLISPVVTLIKKIKCSMSRGYILVMVSLRGQKISKFSLSGKKISVEAGI